MLSDKSKRAILVFLGVIFIFLGVVAYLNSAYNGYLGQIFWLCYIVLILIGLGMLIGDSTLIAAQINIMAIPLLFWSADFIYVLLTGGELFGITNYFFIPGPIIGKLVTSQHLFTLPLSILALYFLKLKRKDIWLFSFIELVIVFAFTRLLTLEEHNVNCVYRSCLNFEIFPGFFYPIIWFALVFILVITTNFILNRLTFLRKKS